jgi:hypothetical protein
MGMRYRLLDSLGTVDARFCNEKFHAGIDLAKLAKGEVIDLNESS